MSEYANHFQFQSASLSNFITVEATSRILLPASASSSFNYQGRINYEPYFGQNLKVSVYIAKTSELEHDETFYGTAGTAVDVLIGGLTSYLTTLHPQLAAFASTLGGALFVAAGAVIVAGVITESFVQQYHVNDWTYDVKTVVSDSGAEHIYHDNHAYQFYLEGEIGEENLSDIMYYDYLEWDDNGVATQFFSDFWGVGNCPGISSYTYA